MPDRQDQALEEILKIFAPQREQLLPILHAVQAALGHVSSASVARIAEYLNLSRAEVHGVVTFYHDFTEAPRSGVRVRVCVAEACQAVGARQLVNDITQVTGADLHESSPDGRYRLEPVYCLGLCACGPAVMVDEQLHGRVSTQRLGQLLKPESSA